MLYFVLLKSGFFFSPAEEIERDQPGTLPGRDRRIYVKYSPHPFSLSLLLNKPTFRAAAHNQYIILHVFVSLL